MGRRRTNTGPGGERATRGSLGEGKPCHDPLYFRNFPPFYRPLRGPWQALPSEPRLAAGSTAVSVGSAQRQALVAAISTWSSATIGRMVAFRCWGTAAGRGRRRWSWVTGGVERLPVCDPRRWTTPRPGTGRLLLTAGVGGNFPGKRILAGAPGLDGALTGWQGPEARNRLGADLFGPSRSHFSVFCR